jgi:hypothetical protein
MPTPMGELSHSLGALSADLTGDAALDVVAARITEDGHRTKLEAGYRSPYRSGPPPGRRSHSRSRDAAATRCLVPWLKAQRRPHGASGSSCDLAKPSPARNLATNLNSLWSVRLCCCEGLAPGLNWIWCPWIAIHFRLKPRDRHRIAFIDVVDDLGEIVDGFVSPPDGWHGGLAFR